MRPGEKAHPRESPPPAPDPTEENVSYPGNRPATNAAIGSGGLRGRSAKKTDDSRGLSPVSDVRSRQDIVPTRRRNKRKSPSYALFCGTVCPDDAALSSALSATPPFVPNAARTPPRRNKSDLAEPSRVRTFVFPREPGQTGVRPCRRIRKTPGKLIPKNGGRAA